MPRRRPGWTWFSVRNRDQTGNLEHFHESINLGNALACLKFRVDLRFDGHVFTKWLAGRIFGKGNQRLCFSAPSTACHFG